MTVDNVVRLLVDRVAWLHSRRRSRIVLPLGFSLTRVANVYVWRWFRRRRVVLLTEGRVV